MPAPRAAATSVACALVLVLAAPPPAAADDGGAAFVEVVYHPPVGAPIVDPFRPPPGPYAAGNRGVEYATAAGTPVRAAAAGEVAFAGAVAGELHVTILHPDGLRTSYSYLASVTVRRGQRVAGGEVVGTSSTRLHFGVRDPAGTYLDPVQLFGGPPVRVRLVAGADEGAPPLREEVSHLRAVVARGKSALRLVLHYRHELQPETRLASMVQAVESWREQTESGCTPADHVIAPPAQRRIAVLVAGLGSTSDHASVDDVDTAAIGYAPGDVVRFSYAGGDVTQRPYTAADTQQDLQVSAARLRALLGDVAASHPGVPIDVIAHSQGGVVASLALGPGAPGSVATLVTLGTPHEGADLATAAAAADITGTPGDNPVLVLATLAGYDTTSPSIGQLSETSDISRSAPATRVAPHVHVRSIAARDDVVVPSPRSAIGGRAPVVVVVHAPNAHAALPGSPAATREIALAVRGLPPGCRGMVEVIGSAAAGEGISSVVDLLGAALLVADVQPG